MMKRMNKKIIIKIKIFNMKNNNIHKINIKAKILILLMNNFNMKQKM